MKQGSADDPFAEAPAESDDDSETEAATDSPAPQESTPADSAGDTSQPTEPSDTGRPSLPYIHARDGVKDGRTQRPVFLREHVETGIDELVDRMEAEFGEDVYKTDVTEAAMAVAQEHPDLVREKLDEWGYGWA